MKRTKQNIVLIGPRASGKSTLGALLSKKIGFTFVDIDDALMEKARVGSMIDMIRTKGKKWLASTEHTLLNTLLTTHIDMVVATGGRTLSHDFSEIKQENIALFKERAFTILPVASSDTIWQRIEQDQYKEHAHLHLEQLRKNFFQSLEYMPLYESVADIIIDTEGKTPEKVVTEICKRMSV